MKIIRTTMQKSGKRHTRFRQNRQRGAAWIQWRGFIGSMAAIGGELVTICNQLEMCAQEEKMRDTDCLDTKGVLRLVQSIPSPKAEPFKIKLTQVGIERLDEIVDPERGADFYRAKWYIDGWINHLFQTIEIRKEFTDEWKGRVVESGHDYAILLMK